MISGRQWRLKHGDRAQARCLPCDRSSGMTRPFRFGVVAPLRTDLPTWRDHVRRIADAGYSTLLMPDVPQWQPALGPTLALAAGLANIRVGTWVLHPRYFRPGLRRGKRTRYRYSLKVASRWVSAPAGHELRTSSELGLPWSHRASGWP